MFAPIGTSTGALTIGGDALYGQHFAGRIDEVRIYNTALSASGIQADMATPIGTPGPADTEPPTVPSGLTASAARRARSTWPGRLRRTMSVSRATGSSAAWGRAAPTSSRWRLRAGRASTTRGWRRRRRTGIGCGRRMRPGIWAAIRACRARPRRRVPDTQPPTVPTGCRQQRFRPARSISSWGASTDNVGVAGYRVERCLGATCSNFVQVATPSGTSYNNTGLAAATTYRYRVRAADAAGNLGGYSSVQSATTQPGPDTQAPTTPGGFTASAVSASQIDLAWNASTDNVGVTGYRVERCQGAGCTNFVQVATPSGTSFNNTGLAAATTYRYRVRAADAAGNLSGYSSVQSATTQAAPDTQPPTVPTGLTATTVSASQINLAWSASTDNVGVTGYRVERCQGAGCSDFVQVATPSGTSFNDTGWRRRRAIATGCGRRMRPAI